VYAVLQKLEERGAVVRLNMRRLRRQSSTQRIASRFQDVLSTTQQALEELATPAAAEYLWNIQGYAAVLD
jgi:sugar-specific transcriptional regulator TrmB